MERPPLSASLAIPFLTSLSRYSVPLRNYPGLDGLLRHNSPIPGTVNLSRLKLIPVIYMGQGFKVYSSSELYCKWPKVAETMTEADLFLPQSTSLICRILLLGRSVDKVLHMLRMVNSPRVLCIGYVR